MSDERCDENETAWVCSICLFEPQRELSDNEKAERTELTVMNGQLVCMAHQSYAQGGEHAQMLLRAQREWGEH